MTLEELINKLKELPQDLVVPFGFGEANSYRGYYDEVAFEPVTNAVVSDMLLEAERAVGTTYVGYKGGEYTMELYTDCHIACYGFGGDPLTNILLDTWGYYAS